MAGLMISILINLSQVTGTKVTAAVKRKGVTSCYKVFSLCLP